MRRILPQDQQGDRTSFRRPIQTLQESPDQAGAQLAGIPCAERFARLEITIAGASVAAPRSRHPLGVNAAYLDGSVRFVPDDVDLLAFGMMVTVNDGRVLDDLSSSLGASGIENCSVR